MRAFSGHGFLNRVIFSYYFSFGETRRRKAIAAPSCFLSPDDTGGGPRARLGVGFGGHVRGVFWDTALWRWSPEIDWTIQRAVATSETDEQHVITAALQGVGISAAHRKEQKHWCFHLSETKQQRYFNFLKSGWYHSAERGRTIPMILWQWWSSSIVTSNACTLLSSLLQLGTNGVIYVSPSSPTLTETAVVPGA